MPQQATQPNVLVIATDHWPGRLLGVNGCQSIESPTLDQLAHNGRRFTRAYSECPVCIPARRTLMTGTTTRTHGDRVFSEQMPMPALPTMAQTFRDAGYQAFGVGKLHVYPPRDRIGFDDVILDEEGRLQFGVIDDYGLFLGDQGYAGQRFAHGMCNNEYISRPWHLPEDCHVTNWATQQMARVIKRRDPTRPGFWYLSYSHPHPPLAPLSVYLDLYRDRGRDPKIAAQGDWAADPETLPSFLQAQWWRWDGITPRRATAARQAFYALCTHIDHQLRIVIGTLREEGLLDNTIILFTSDHGDMLGDHGFWAKRLFYEGSANIPMILVGAKGDQRVEPRTADDRLVGLQDVMPTLLDLAGIDIPESVEGLSMVGEQRRADLYGECSEGYDATRMIHDGRYKLIYYAGGNVTQLFDLQEDPRELHNLAACPEHADTLDRLTARLIEELYGSDEQWLQEGRLVGLPARPNQPVPNRGLYGQRGSHWPPPPRDEEAISLL
jgi:arylsulfatase A-like enzyme